jgi:hypothetical protein
MLGRERIGLVLNEENAWADAAELDELGPRWVRSLVTNLDRFQERLANTSADIGVIALLNSQTFLESALGVTVGLETVAGWEERWSNLIDRFALQFGNDRFPDRRIVVECLNEWDLLGLPAEVAVRSVRIAAPKLRAAGLGCLLGSVASADWPAQLDQAVALLTLEDRELLDGACFHPYLKTVGGETTPLVPSVFAGQQALKDAVASASAIVNPPAAPELKFLPLWLTEFGLNRNDAQGGVDEQCAYLIQAYTELGEFPPEVLAAACWFCWNDRTGVCHEEGGETVCEQFGLRPADDAQPAYDTRAAYIQCTSPLVVRGDGVIAVGRQTTEEPSVDALVEATAG